jgi:hypothetical protein
VYEVLSAHSAMVAKSELTTALSTTPVLSSATTYTV